MTTEAEINLIGELRNLVAFNQSSYLGDLARKAADRIQSLEAERDRLRDALRPFAEWARLHEAAHPEAVELDNVHYLQAPCPEISDHTVIVVNWGHFAEARAAIGETPYCDRDREKSQNADALWDALRKVVCSTRPHTDATAIVMLGRQDLDKALAAIEVKP